jgi:transcription-repair coupling factor (superfamily II helicase)
VNRILSAFATLRSCTEAADSLPERDERLTVTGAVGSAGSALVGTLHELREDRIFVVIAPDPRVATSIEADLEVLLGEGASVMYPQREALPFETGEPHLEIGGLRVEAIEALLGGRARLLVTTPRALQERAPLPRRLADLRLTIKRGDSPGFHALIEALEARSFERVPIVEEVGQFAVRGGILDVFSFGTPEPMRVEFWGDEIESIRYFDILDQRSKRTVEEAHVLPVDFPGDTEEGENLPLTLFDVLPVDAVLVTIGDLDLAGQLVRTWDYMLQLHGELRESGGSPPDPESLFLSPGEALELFQKHPHLHVTEAGPGDLDLAAEPPPAIERDMKVLHATLREGAGLGEDTLIVCDNQGQCDRLEEILGDRVPRTQIAVGSLAAGFVLPDSVPPLRVLTDHEIFRRSRRVRRSRRFRGAVALESLSQLTAGDAVVHMEHGVGIFRGLEHVKVGGQDLEAMAIEYAGGEVLRVPVYRLDLVERWVAEADGSKPPPVHRIGGKRWKTLRRKTQEAIEKMTAELIQLYAERSVTEGFAFSPDTKWQKEMESSFLYEDTPDQRRATEDVKRDMESSGPMDRLICGDVGYGKTEVAIRAAFKAVQDGKQVAVLAPTTILVEQHRHTFEERLADFPVRVRSLSRFRSTREQKELIEEVQGGTVDIVVGTHRLLSPDVEFKALGLMIVDEEQRFGVKHKERLKQLKTSMDVLTLTATPIPRTMYLSLSGLRDLSVIRTPPRDRMPIITHVIPWSEQLLSEALHRELDRGGQSFFLHNRVETIDAAAERVRILVPEARVGVAHGQMSPKELDGVMTAFVDGDMDVLVCSSIIENGLDVPDANTLVVNRADQFGLSQLYQIRGRVGRSDRRAYCYLVVPDRISEEAEKRLRVLEHYTELGSGYSVALRDLELRGAGNLLGSQQSGFAHAMGIDAYVRLLEETARRLTASGKEREYPLPEISMAGSAFLPDEYVSESSQKLHLYRRLSKLETIAAVNELRAELDDRFGAPPPEVERLLDSASLRILGRRLGVERVLIRDREARVNFRTGVVPRLTVLDEPLRDSDVDVEVRRMNPLSLALRQMGSRPLATTLIEALSALLSAKARAA